MDTSNLCMYCMQENGGNSVCPHCGKDANAPLIGNHLKPGDLLGGRFLVGRAVGQDASGVVYIVLDTVKGNKLRIREYLPRGIAARGEDSVTLSAMPGMSEQFDEGMSEMLSRAESAEDPSHAMAHFEENGTLYVILRRKKATAPVPAEVEDEQEPVDADYDEEEEYEEEEDSSLVDKIKKNMTGVMIGLFIVLLLGASIFILVSRSSRDNTSNPSGALNTDPLGNWVAPTETPLPTLTATDEFGNIIKPEQDWQNEAGGSSLDWDTPEKTPIPDDYEPDWLTDATNVPMNTSTPEPSAATAEPEITATPRPTLKPELIDRHSDEETIRQLQTRLIELGWMDSDERTGKLDDSTQSAVKSFQQYIHDHLDDSMDVDGYAGAQTVKWLNRDDAPHNPKTQPTAAPSDDTTTGTNTPEATDAVRATLKPELIDRHSDEKTIRQLQARLIELGWLEIDEPTGQLGNMTKNAIKAFQEYVHEYHDKDMEADGYAGAYTVEWLNRDDAPRNPALYPTPVPTETPVPTPPPEEPAEETATPDPDATPDPNATDEPPYAPDDATTQEVQNRLIELGWMNESQRTGVYDNATMLALKDYQRYLNQINPNAELPENGKADESTLLWLRWDGAPSRPDVLPQTTETPEPSATPEPEYAPFEVREDSPQEDIVWLQEKLNELQWMNISPVTGVYDQETMTAVSNLQSYLKTTYTLDLVVDGICGSVTTSYLTSNYNPPINPNPDRAVTSSAPVEGATQDPNQAPGTEGTVTPEPEDTVVPTDTPEPVPTDTPEPVPTDTPEPVPTDTPEPVPTDTPEPVPTDTPEPVPTDTPEPVPTDTPEPTEDPNSYVDESSETARIEQLQKRLIALKWLSEDKATGEYDDDTKEAVAAFQNWLSNNWDDAWGDRSDLLPEILDGSKADQKTLDLLNNSELNLINPEAQSQE